MLRVRELLQGLLNLKDIKLETNMYVKVEDKMHSVIDFNLDDDMDLIIEIE